MPRVRSIIQIFVSLLALACSASAHGDHEGDEDHSHLSWQDRHMLEEHHLATYTLDALFQMHDLDQSGTLSSDELLFMYGVLPTTSLEDVPQAKRDEIATALLAAMDSNHDHAIEMDEWMAWMEADKAKGGKGLPDYGLGPGHHGDDEYEYEIHHFEKYHDENTKEEDLIHPEDIAHFKKHDEQHKVEEGYLAQEKMAVIEANIPAQFRADR